MKTKKPASVSFEDMSRAHVDLVTCEKQADEARARKDALLGQVNKMRDKHMLAWLIESATENFRKHLSSDDPCLLNYFISLFKDRGRSFTDTAGASGFPLPPSKMREVPGTKKDQEMFPGLQGKVQRMLNYDHRPSVPVNALTIYLSPNGQNNRDDESSPNIELVIQTDGSHLNTITPKHFTNCRIALIQWRDGYNPVPSNLDFPDSRDYMLKLVELSTPETMFEQVFRHHGPVKLG